MCVSVCLHTGLLYLYMYNYNLNDNLSFKVISIISYIDIFLLLYYLLH